MNNYCGYIEVWSCLRGTNQSHCPLPINSLEQQTNHTVSVGLKTIAIFKIKLK